MFGLIILNWSELPLQIPVHYAFDGAIDRWGGRYSVFILPAMALFLSVLLTLCRFLPEELYNLPVPVTSENRERLIALAREMLSVIKAACALLLTLIFIPEIKCVPLPGWYTALLLLVFLPVGIYILRMVNNK